MKIKYFFNYKIYLILWLRKHRVDSGLVDARDKPERIAEVIATLSCMLAAVGTIPEGTRVTVEEIARPPRDMPKRKHDAHRAKITDFIANVEVQNIRNKKQLNRNDQTRLIEMWNANRLADQHEAAQEKRKQEAVLFAKALMNPFAALKDVFNSKSAGGGSKAGAAVVTLPNGKQVDASKTYTALEACALVMGASQFRQVRTKDKDALRKLPDKALKDV